MKRACLVLVLTLGLGISCAELQPILEDILESQQVGELTLQEIIAGLKEALRVGTGNAVEIAGRTDGYFLNEAIRILLPEDLRKFENALRIAGLGDELDEFVLSMNRAAEKAAPEARAIFWNAIRDMTFADARRILEGGETEATDYFEDRTRLRLIGAFRPIVSSAMDEVEAPAGTRNWSDSSTSCPSSRSATPTSTPTLRMRRSTASSTSWARRSGRSAPTRRRA